MKIIILTVVGYFGGTEYSYAIQAENMDRCYEMAARAKADPDVKAVHAVCNTVRISQ